MKKEKDNGVHMVKGQDTSGRKCPYETKHYAMTIC